MVVGPARGTAKGGADVCAPGLPKRAVPPAATWGTRCASPCDSLSCRTPGPGASTDGGADVGDDGDDATNVGPPTGAAGGTGTACCGG